MNKIYVTLLLFAVLTYAPGLHSEDMVDEYIGRMSLREKVGQLFLIGFNGKTIGKEDVAHIKKINPGGFVLYGRNFQRASDITPFVTNIRAVVKHEELPSFFAIDQEGGIVHRIEDAYYKPPSGPSIGATDSDELARETGLSVGSALRSLGINMNLAPVLDMPEDVHASPMTMRSFGNDAGRVERMGVSYIHGLREAGLLATAKHFPGIGQATEDSHKILPHIVWKGREDRDNDVRPFKSAIRAGVDVVMTSHFIAEPGDAKDPVSLSSYWMNDVLRKELGFEGLILVDNIEMKAIENMMPIPQAAVRSFKAGADIIMISHGRKNQEDVFNAFLEAVQAGEISQERIQESLRRIVKAKMNLRNDSKDAKTASLNLGEISRTVAEHSIVVLQQKKSDALRVGRQSHVLYAGYNAKLFDLIKDAFPNTEILNAPPPGYGKKESEAAIKRFLERFDAVIIDADHHEASAIVSVCNDFNLSYLLVLGRPRSIQRTIERLGPRQMAILFENGEVHLQAAVDIISGIRRPTGRLPYDVKLPADYSYSPSI